MNIYSKMFFSCVWPGIVTIVYGLLFLTPEFQYLLYKWIAFVYVMIFPVIVHMFLDQRRYEKECQKLAKDKK